jgi:hypothetical protein
MNSMLAYLIRLRRDYGCLNLDDQDSDGMNVRRMDIGGPGCAVHAGPSSKSP